MYKNQKITALIGSTQHNSTSKAMVDYLQQKFSNHDIKIDTYKACEVYQNEQKFTDLVTHISQNSLFLICAPVYIDSLSYPLISTLEQIYSCKDDSIFHDKKLIAIIHSGFPEKIHRESAIEICYNFAKTMGFDWQGVVDFGVSSIIEGKPLKELGIASRWIRKSLDELVEKIVNKEKVSSGVIRKSLNLPIPLPIPIKWFPPILNFMINRKLKKEGVEDILARPY
ncbi:MAG: NAD(P)H-dependent oxidoreductase [Candidatus Mcinerneyibacterium aminivorans]|jgi:hypothetical protein|uniref:NAD(P)H-dependent oxidoreductase n=1 Tax=Candidatus Mcinerneyibacterium aminivorans TaxID=2703815 RepID=A0A5D0MGX5_9BACT|nr:MAG: NAD(P)H-dependent oxidoreductase [Candidatus Mcinerneyibacterium aminivorans]